MKSNRTEIIYDIYSFLYREPQHLGRMKNPNSRYDTYDKAMAHLRNMEVTLNHLANVFFSFLPSNLLHQFFETALQKPLWSDEYDVFVRSLENVVQEIGDFTQPDIFFVGDKNTISVEMKVGAKSSLDQIMKYGLLHHKEQLTSGVEKSYHLIYLGQGSFSSLRYEKFEDVYALKQAFAEYEIPAISKKGKIALAEYADIIKKMVAEMSISYISYEDLKQFCADHLEETGHNRQIYKLLT
jgi:hypothetical protein